MSFTMMLAGALLLGIVILLFGLVKKNRAATVTGAVITAFMVAAFLLLAFVLIPNM